MEDMDNVEESRIAEGSGSPHITGGADADGVADTGGADAGGAAGEDDVAVEDRSGTPYDDVFHTLAVKGGRWRIPLVNAMFGTSHGMDAPVQTLSDELYTVNRDGTQRRIVADTVLEVEKHLYHVECQTNPDGSILVRMFEYDMAVAGERSRYETSEGRGVLVVDLPRSGVLFLRPATEPADGLFVQLRTGDGRMLEYPVAVMQMTTISVERIARQRLLILVPFILFAVEPLFPAAQQGDCAAIREIDDLLAQTIGMLNTMYVSGELSAEHYLLFNGMLRKTAEALTRKYRNVRRQVEDIMGGRILTFEGEDLINKGRAEGITQGRAEGKAEGMEEGALNTLLGLVRSGKITVADAADFSHRSEQEIRQLLAARS